MWLRQPPRLKVRGVLRSAFSGLGYFFVASKVCGLF
jgi:hypothetical protein